jgi:16S rRNA (adenine1518-N6/adenine1519-N6)-dimethyltransferase
LPVHPKALLRRYGLQPKQSLGQNFLWDENVLAKIADTCRAGSAEEVIEIGAGLGSLTSFLSSRFRRVVAVEIDGRLVPILLEVCAGYRNVEIVKGDFLVMDVGTLVGGEFAVAGNVPYYITGSVIRRLIDLVQRPLSLTLTVQEEVAQRLASGPGEMSLISVAVQLYGRPRIVTDVKAGSFWPRPEVGSSVVHVPAHEAPLVTREEEGNVMQLARAGFHQRRKQLLGNLVHAGYAKGGLEKCLGACQIDGRRRAETLSVDEWIRLSRCLLPDISPLAGM